MSHRVTSAPPMISGMMFSPKDRDALERIQFGPCLAGLFVLLFRRMTRMGAGLAANLVLDLALIPGWGAAGAAAATLATAARPVETVAIAGAAPLVQHFGSIPRKSW